MTRRKRIPVREETHEWLSLKKAENGANSFDDLIRDMGEEAFGERPEEDDPSDFRESMEKALFGDE